MRLIRSSGKLFCLLGIQLCIQPPPSLPSLRASLSHLPFCSSSVKVRIRVGMRVQDGAGGCAQLLHPELMERKQHKSFIIYIGSGLQNRPCLCSEWTGRDKLLVSANFLSLSLARCCLIQCRQESLDHQALAPTVSKGKSAPSLHGLGRRTLYFC